MTRDIKQEKRVRLASWLAWKIGAIILLIAAVALPAVLLADKMGWIKDQNVSLQEAIVLPLIYLALAWLSWWIGKALDRLKSWAWWTTVILYLFQLLENVLTLFMIPFYKELFKGDMMWFFPLMLAMTLLGFVFTGYVLWALLSKRGRRIFSDEYRNRLKHGSFNAFQVTPQK